MKSFYSQSPSFENVPNEGVHVSASAVSPALPQGLTACVAVYDSLAAAPRVHEIPALNEGDLIEALANAAYSLAREAGGPIPYTAIREIVENYLHADFRDTVVSIMDGGCVVSFSDHGPGIADKTRAMRPGFSTATTEMRRYIRGVGSGLPIVNEFLTLNGGALEIEDNLGTGTVVTLHTTSTSEPLAAARDPLSSADRLSSSSMTDFPRLTTRQKRVVSLVMEIGDVGPTLVSKELGVGLSTAYRDLAFLEERGLIAADESGKRRLTLFGSEYLDALFG